MRSRKLLCLMGLLLCLLLCACGKSQAPQRDSVTLWYPEGDPAAVALAALAEQYNQTVDRDLLPVSLRALPGADSLAALQSGALPDLLLCSHGEAQVLAREGLLRDVNAALGDAVPSYREGLLPGDSAMGRSVFPLGGAVQLLCLSAEAQAPKDLDELFALAAAQGRENGLPYLAVDSYAPLYDQQLLQQGAAFQPLWDSERPGETQAAAYNRIARAAFDHGLALAESPAAVLVQAGLLPCAVVDSTSLPGLELSSCRLLPLPGIDGDTPYVTDPRCLAVTAREGRAGRSLTAFLDWLLTAEHLDALCQSAGLAPIHTDAAGDGSTLSGVLLDIGNSRSLYPADDDPAYRENRAAFEAQIREALSRLA
ncbi:MAG: hypothetical protein IJ179_09130 [Oscillospiraceae bacterium]|nr:hypothetical protein [Oscillospiraceae bacterium]